MTDRTRRVRGIKARVVHDVVGEGGRAGIAIPANPTRGCRFRQECYEGEAEDRGAAVDHGVGPILLVGLSPTSSAEVLVTYGFRGADAHLRPAIYWWWTTAGSGIGGQHSGRE